VRKAGGELVMYVGPPRTATVVSVKHDDDDEVFEAPKPTSNVTRKPNRSIGSAVGVEARGAPEGSEGCSVGDEVTSVSEDEFEALEKNEAIVDELLNKNKTPTSKSSVEERLKDKPLTHDATKAMMDELLKDKPKTSSSDAFAALEKKRSESGGELTIHVDKASGKGEVVDRQVKGKSKSSSVKSIVDEEILLVAEDAEVFQENDAFFDALETKTPSPSKIPRPIQEPKSPPPAAKVPASKIPVPVGKKAPSPSPTRKSPPSPSPNRKSPPSPSPNRKTPQNKRQTSPSPVRKASTEGPRRKSIDEKEPRRKSIDEKEPRRKSADEKEPARRKSVEEKEPIKVIKEKEIKHTKSSSSPKSKN
jgi:hypothetical protein